jgi:hypothetical protein
MLNNAWGYQVRLRQRFERNLCLILRQFRRNHWSIQDNLKISPGLGLAAEEPETLAGLAWRIVQGMHTRGAE